MLPHLPLETRSTESSRQRNPSSDQRQEAGEQFSERRAEAWGPASPHGFLPPLLPGSAPGQVYFGVGLGLVKRNCICTQRWCSFLLTNSYFFLLGVFCNYHSTNDDTRLTKGDDHSFLRSERGLEMPPGQEASTGHKLDWCLPWAHRTLVGWGHLCVRPGISITHAELPGLSHPASPRLASWTCWVFL